ncbi:hypothetical protein Hbl1158_13615 [Halobaculum sp. CBA1158]|uniref:hypothetical protein n=1 Tax=Halobaculum sp. CBA1158 TaxID=2904243 RepID=UPI001F45F780|nr:hypothetical protein [Halobaculum sp. CBA1158]UIO99546.1 hypothetical protein Hbl1158_13615 [Halobaculum sp. CBA1158]
MSDRLSGAWLARAFAGLSVLGLVLSVAGVAAMAIAAESIGRKTWGAYFAMEQAMAIGTPVAVTFAGLSVLGGFAIVYTTDASDAASNGASTGRPSDD